MIRVALCMFVLAMPAFAIEPSGAPKHLNEAVKLVQTLKLKNTHYNHGEPEVRWKGLDGAQESVVHTDCSGFLDALFAKCYGCKRSDFKRWLGKNRPTADCYHDAIVKQNGFENIPAIKDVRPGDLLAVKYLTNKPDTGHVMLVAGAPKKMPALQPLVPGTEQWEVRIIDCSKSGHGPTDTRHRRGKTGKDHTGLGEGVLRIYVHKGGTDNGRIAGWAWSTRKISRFLDPKEEDLVIGRLKSELLP
jgi:cell wall-associated NlpC family hydrolase